MNFFFPEKGSSPMHVRYVEKSNLLHSLFLYSMKEFVPVEYRKKKDMEKKIFHEHRKLQGMTELNAKFRYVQLCRSLKTYGVTFFEVKVKVL